MLNSVALNQSSISDTNTDADTVPEIGVLAGLRITGVALAFVVLLGGIEALGPIAQSPIDTRAALESCAPGASAHEAGKPLSCLRKAQVITLPR